MTNFESTSYHVEDQAGESVAFTVLPPTADQETAGTGEHDPVLRLWSTQVMPDNRVINVEVGFSYDDVRGLQSYLNTQFGRGIAREASGGPIAPALYGDHTDPGLSFIPIPQPEMKAGDRVTAHVGDEISHYRVGEDGKTLTPDLELPGMWEQSDFSGGETDSAPVQPNYTPGPEVYAQRQCPAISNGQQCTRPENHGNTDGLTHYFPSQGLQVEGQPMYPQTGDGAATPPATAPTSTPVAPGGEQADVSATGARTPAAAPSSAPTEKPKRKRRTKLEIAFDEAKEAYDAAANESTYNTLAQAMSELSAKDPGNSRLNQTAEGVRPAADQPQPVPAAQPIVQFAGEPVNPFTQPAPDPQSYGAPFPGNVPAIPAIGQLAGAQSVQVSPAEQQAAQAFPCQQMDQSGTRQCVRPFGHELMTAANPEPKPHMFATDPSTLGQPLQPAPTPMQPQQPAFSVTTPALTGMTDGGAQILSFQTPPTPADPTAFQVQGANLQPPAPAAPFLQPTPNGGQ